jgi:hypothetical protein
MECTALAGVGLGIRELALGHRPVDDYALLLAGVLLYASYALHALASRASKQYETASLVSDGVLRGEVLE